MLTDSKQTSSVITRATQTTKKGLDIDVAAAREAHNRHTISNVGLVTSERSMADRLTKPGLCPALDTMMRTRAEESPVQQWSILSNPATSTASRGASPTEMKLTTVRPLATVEGSTKPTRSDVGTPGV